MNDEVLVIPGESYEDAKIIPLVPGVNTDRKEKWRDDFERAIQLLRMSDMYVAGLPERSEK